jgi:mannose-6-phosphate isomerase-like protein (cupin superfamily)
MAVTLGRFDALAWQPGGHPLERKKAVANRNAVLLEFAPGFSDPFPCQRSHVLYVVEGTLELGLEDEVIAIEAGQCAIVEQGTFHRAANRGSSRTVVFVVSDVQC